MSIGSDRMTIVHIIWLKEMAWSLYTLRMLVHGLSLHYPTLPYLYELRLITFHIRTNSQV